MDNLSFSLTSLDPFINEENVHIYMKQNGRKKITIINGLSLENIQQFLKESQQKFGTSGYLKLVPDINQKNEVICFHGDVRIEIKDFLIKNYKKSKNHITIHGI